MSDGPSEFFYDDFYDETCDCGSGLEENLECAACHVPGCAACLIAWDDVYDYLCHECAGDDMETMED